MLVTGLELPLLTLVLLVAAALVAGWVDAVVGGGGLIQLPSLLIGLPSDTPVATIGGTNKLPSMCGTSVAAATYIRTIKIDWTVIWPLLLGAAAGSAGGAQLARFVPRDLFTPIVLAVIIGIGWYTLRRPHLGKASSVRHHADAARVRLAVIGLCVGLWDGLIGPGTGTFFVILLVSVIGHDFLAASAMAKLANLATNLAAVISFGLTGHVLWGLGLVMAAANVTGGYLGARTALRHGNVFVRRVFLAVITALAIKLTFDLVTQHLPL